MTSIHLQTGVTRTDSDSDGETRPKDVLFCPDCGHESPTADEWNVVIGGNTRRIVCPRCDHIVAAR